MRNPADSPAPGTSGNVHLAQLDVTQERDRKRVEWALGDVINNQPALSRWHPDYLAAFAAHEASG